MKLVRISAAGNRFGSFGYRVADAEELEALRQKGVNLYGPDKDLVFSPNMLGKLDAEVEIPHRINEVAGKGLYVNLIDPNMEKDSMIGYEANRRRRAGVSEKTIAQLEQKAYGLTVKLSRELDDDNS